ncbi:branched-chain amino acid ABC transporter permease [Actinomadura chibensis]|uniref:Branched-chain amino acid ABC transporter permease n=1 Tax=Actinomadura chibensis TaxID=392828 RepID=A0A5D0N9S1_9ACTN|nr:branched-chain amino acid ABC transporter permease [Actinomadura chibensis]TYB41061.1 branched-chain amino acid ABC transporter permease [Actinomadura chibensis]
MTTLLQLTFAGLSLGAVYALISLGWTVLFQVARIYNLAQGAFVVVSAMTYIALADDLGWPVPLAVAGALAVCLALGLALYGVILNRRTARGEAGPIVMSLGSALVIAETLRYLWGVDARTAAAFLPTGPVRIMGATAVPHAMLLWTGTAAMFGAAWLLFHRTLLGKALRACAESATAAQVVGIDPRRMRLAAFGVAALFGGVGGILLAPLIAVSPHEVLPLGIFGFIGAVVGRWRYLPAAAGSVLLGLITSYAGGYGATSWQNAVLYGSVIAALLTMRQRRPGHRPLSGVRGLVRRGDRTPVTEAAGP